MAKRIKLTHGYIATVDDEDFALVSRFKWRPEIVKRGSGKPVVYAVVTVRMHNLITGKPQIDHKDRNGLHNQRHNLRNATTSQNAANRKRNSNNTSGYKGVVFHAPSGKWRARLGVKGKRISLGLFKSKAEAARIYDTAARKHFGEFARCNFI